MDGEGFATRNWPRHWHRWAVDYSARCLCVLVFHGHGVLEIDGEVRDDLSRRILLAFPGGVFLRLSELDVFLGLSGLLPVEDATRPSSRAEHGIKHSDLYRRRLLAACSRSTIAADLLILEEKADKANRVQLEIQFQTLHLFKAEVSLARVSEGIA